MVWIFDHQSVPGTRYGAQSRVRQCRKKRLGRFDRRQAIGVAVNHECWRGDFRCGLKASRIAITGPHVSIKGHGVLILIASHAVADHPHAGVGIAAEEVSLAECE